MLNENDLLKFAKDTDKVLGAGSVVNMKLVAGVYFEFEMDSEENAITIETMWKSVFKNLTTNRNGKKVMAI